MQLDKDIIGNGRVYSPETCRFVPRWLNNIFLDHKASRGQLPQGVSQRGSGYQMRLGRGGERLIKTFQTVEEATNAYITAKMYYVRSKYHLLDLELIRGCERKLAELLEHSKI